jgi:four helix bundle protein
MEIQKFEEMKVWKESREFVKLIYKTTNNEKFKKDFCLRDQIQRASVSIIANIAEEFDRNNNKEFVRFLIYSKGSVAEVRALLYIAYFVGYIDLKDFEYLHTKTISIGSQLSNFIKYLKEHQDKQSKNYDKFL